MTSGSASRSTRLSRSDAVNRRKINRSVSRKTCDSSALSIFRGKAQRKVSDPDPSEIGHAKIETRCDRADLVPNPMRDDRRLRVVQDGARLRVGPTRASVDFRDKRQDTERGEPVAQLATLRIEDLALPQYPAGIPRGSGVDLGPGSQEQGSGPSPARNLATRARPVSVVQLGAGRLDQLRHINRQHVGPPTNELCTHDLTKPGYN